MRTRTRHRITLAICIALLAVVAREAKSLLETDTEGDWPSTWPKELEPLRKTSWTVGIATGNHEIEYGIPFTDRQTFESTWPSILSVRSPGATLKLVGAADQPKGANHPTVIIRTPSTAGYQNWKEVEADLNKVRTLGVGGPWPNEIPLLNGQLPEYVIQKEIDGKPTWVAPTTQESKEPDFFFRARTDIELVVDGEIIDLNRIKLPDHTNIVDLRFPAPTSQPSK